MKSSDIASIAGAKPGRRSRAEVAVLFINVAFCLAQIGFWAGGINPYR